MSRVGPPTVGGEIGAAFPKRFGARTVFSRLKFFGSFLETSHTGIIRALFVMRTRCFSQVQVKVGVINYCTIRHNFCIFARTDKGRMRAALFTGPSIPVRRQMGKPRHGADRSPVGTRHQTLTLFAKAGAFLETAK